MQMSLLKAKKVDFSSRDVSLNVFPVARGLNTNLCIGSKLHVLWRKLSVRNWEIECFMR